MKNISQKFFFATFIVFSCLHISLLYSQRLYPFIDLPYHLAIATIVKYYGSATNNFSEYFTVAGTLFRPHVLHVLFCNLDIFPSVEFGNKIFFCLYALLFPLSVLLLIFKFKGNPWFSILTFLLLYNFNVCWGFTEYAFSIPLFFLFFYVFTHYLGKGTPFNSLLTALLFLILYFAHSLTTIFALMVFTVCLAVKYRSKMSTGLKKSVIVFPVLLLIVSSKGSVTGQGFIVTLKRLGSYYVREYLDGIPDRAGHLLFGDNSFLFSGLTGQIWSLIFSSAVLLPFVFALVWRRKDLGGVLRDPDKQPLLILFLCALGCCCFLPAGVLNAWAIYQRFSVILFAVIIILNSVLYAEKIRSFLLIYLVTVCLLYYGLWNNYYSEFSEENKTFTASFFQKTKSSETLGAQIFEHDYRGQAVYVHFSDYYITWKQGIAASGIINFGQTGVQRKVRDDLLPAYNEWQEKMWKQHGDRYYKYSGIREAVSTELLPVYNAWLGSKLKLYDNRYGEMDYVLTRGKVPEPAKRYLQSFKLIQSSDSWQLYQSQKHMY